MIPCHHMAAVALNGLTIIAQIFCGLKEIALTAIELQG